MLDTLLLALKLIGSVLAGIFGAIGTIHDYKDNNGSITKWGRIALFGIIISSIVAISAQLVEEALNQKSAEEVRARIETQIQTQQILLSNVSEQSIRSSRVLKSIQRTFNRIETLSGDFWLSLPHTHKAFNDYSDRLKTGVDNLLVNPGMDHEIYISRTRKNPDGSQTPSEVSVPSYSGFFPNNQEQPLRRLMGSGLAISIYRTPVKADEFLANRWTGRGQPDLQLSMSLDEPELNIELESQRMELSASLVTNRQYWDTNGKIASLNDLAGSQIWFFVDHPGGFPEEHSDNNAVLSDLVRKASIRTVILRINEIELWFREKDLSKRAVRDGGIAWVITMPSNLEDILDRFVK